MAKFNPKVILSAAISLDGKIATISGDSKLSSKIDLVRLHKLRSQVDCILIGKTTAIKDDPLLTVRYVKGKNPIRVILDSSGTIKNNSKILQTSKQIRTIIVVSEKITEQNLQRLKKFPIEIMVNGKTHVDIKSLIKKLNQMQIRTILLEGGGTINWEFIKNDLVDEFFITITPFILGGKRAISFVQGDGFDEIKNSLHLRLNGIKRLENDLVLHYTKL